MADSINLPPVRVNLTGQKFCKLTVTEYVGKDSKNSFWKCRCDCGNECVVSGSHLKSGHTKSCGCLQKEVIAKNRLTHGKSNCNIYKIWAYMKNRCMNIKAVNYERYGERGISIYPEWVDNFQAFYDYVSTLDHFGEKGYSLDRIDNNGNYEPNNLRWATNKEQSRNRRSNIVVEYEGEKISLIEAAERSGIKYATLQLRYGKGDRDEKLFRPVQRKSKT